MLGLYFPSIGYLKSDMIDDADRGTVYSLFRLPLNCFVVGMLSTVKEGKSTRHLRNMFVPANQVAVEISRSNRFTICTALLLTTALVVQRYLVK